MCSVVIFYFFFFKQKTAYEMRISDWSSDVCSSDLLASKLALAPDDPVRINSIAGITQVNTVTIPRLSYGRGMMPSVQAPVLEAINLGAPGLLGLDGLASKRLTIDFRKQTMEVSDSGERVAKIGRAQRRERG